ncbi:hypothetical protein AAG906_005593 [Vitis piasezkii]
MVDGFRWKPVLSRPMGAFSSLYSLYVCITAFSSHLISCVIRLILFTLSTFTTWRVVMSFPLSILRTHHWVHGSRDLLYLLHFIHEGMGFDHRVFELSFLRFLSPYHPSLTLRPCLKTTTRPWDRISSSTDSYVEICNMPPGIFPLIVSLQSGVQSRRSFTVYDIQSHHVTFFSSTFRVTSPVVGIQSHHHFLASVFRAIIITVHRHHHVFSSALSHRRFRIDIQSRVLGFGVQSRYHSSAVLSHRHHRVLVRLASSVSTFVVITPRPGVRVIVITVCSVRHSEPSSVFRSTFRVTSPVSAFRVVITSQFGVQSHHHHFLV